MNTLHKEDSPYLQQHKDNPVHWQPWNKEALRLAQKHKKPIFVSIGYSTCHWCHVMEREVFESQKFANMLNEHFISIKIDKEERPDIDKYYQEIYHIMNNKSGGWPLSVFLTHNAKPFFCGTYIPPENRYGLLGFGELIELILEKYKSNFDDIQKSSISMAKLMSSKEHTQKSQMDKNINNHIKSYLEQRYDKEYGGFSEAPKFPHADTLLYILDLKDEVLLSMCKYTLRQMSQGGLYDVVEGGFCRYSTDEMWLVPHFEKMLYDNGLLIETFAKAYYKFDEVYFKNIAIQSADFMIEKMSENYLFYSASDADTQGKEGEYFVYSYDELQQASIDENTIQSIGATKKGNFECKNIIRSFDLDTKTRNILKGIRATRKYPFIDKKVMVFQNAMMIKALFVLSTFDKKYFDFAQKSLHKLINDFFKNNLKRTKIYNQKPKIDGFLEDYAYLIDTLITAYNYTKEPLFLDTAKSLLDISLKKFYKDGLWYFGEGDFKALEQPYDNAYPNSISIMLNAILKLSFLDKSLRDILEKTTYACGGLISKAPFACLSFVRVLNKDIIKITANTHNFEMILKELNPLQIENIIFEDHTKDNIILCDDKSCFANEHSPKDIIAFLKQRF